VFASVSVSFDPGFDRSAKIRSNDDSSNPSKRAGARALSDLLTAGKLIVQVTKEEDIRLW